MRNRLDKLLLAQGLAPSRERAQALILAGRVLVDQQKVEKPGANVEDTAILRVLGEEQRYVSRGGLKLEAALTYWQIDLRGRHCADIGTSTGGFTDCMLQHGAAKWRSRCGHWLRTDCRSATPGSKSEPAGAHQRPLPQAGRSGPRRSRLYPRMCLSISATLVLPAVLAAARESPGTALEAVILAQATIRSGQGTGRQGRHRTRPGRAPVRDRSRSRCAPRSWCFSDRACRLPHFGRRRSGQRESRVSALRPLLNPSRTLKPPCALSPSFPSPRRKSLRP